MKSVKNFVVAGAAVASAISLCVSQAAFAHVVVKPTEVATASYQTFTISVPNEKDTPTTEIKLEIPKGVTSVTPTVKSGWSISQDIQGKGESRTVTSITWSGGEIDKGLRDDFTFSAKTPDETGELRWNAYQTYEDGSVVAWDKGESEGRHSHDDFSTDGPFSVTTVSTDMVEDDNRTYDHEEGHVSADWAVYLSMASLCVAFGALFVVLRKK